MVFTKKYIRQVIMEEFTDYVGMKANLKSEKNSKLESLRRELINLFSYYRDLITDKTLGTNESEKDLYKALESIRQEYKVNKTKEQFIQFCIYTLRDVADPQLVNFIRNVFRKGDLGSEKDKLDNYEMSISPEEEKFVPYSNAGTDFKVPKTAAAYDQEDLRKDIKTLVK